ncbi:hypothetical protein GLAREA_02441 [Glarea lozoyensis ATCC 20868]|uniref:DUF6594 domain-containing protein n=1 Tax=Glarea lozoyensis (strain ATCC 20868 / MF5171) TaxID=1116229 RepID=S3DJ00_GLAL2|nr:uncharacterized protein GLAREA_02441 [Glarea lozoyensis ATCC 20868]EPE26528.1 hypothetical protein GLAREA_02441 [Glarea lozoyensis ATCC 20868]
MSNTVELCDRTPDIEAQRASHATQGGTASVEPARRSDIDDSQKVLDQFSQIVSTTTVSLMSDFENTQKRLGVLLFLDYDRNTQEINRVYSTLLTSRVPPSSRTDIGIATELYLKSKKAYDDHVARSVCLNETDDNIEASQPIISSNPWANDCGEPVKTTSNPSRRSDTLRFSTPQSSNGKSDPRDEYDGYICKVSAAIMGLDKIDDLSMETLRAVLDLNRHETEEFASNQNASNPLELAIQLLPSASQSSSFNHKQLKTGRSHQKHELYTYEERLSFAVVGGLAILTPMTVMSILTSLFFTTVTAITSVMICAFLLAIFMKDSRLSEILGVTAAYAAVLVVFVGASIDSEDTGNKVWIIFWLAVVGLVMGFMPLHRCIRRWFLRYLMQLPGIKRWTRYLTYLGERS